MPLIVYLDETGDHSLGNDDKAFPIFALVMLVTEFSAYARQIVPDVFQLKLDYWGHESIVLHSRDIRKAKGCFAFLTNPNARSSFYERINRLMSDSDYRLVPVVIRKDHQVGQHGEGAENPYDLALGLAMGRLVCLLEETDQEIILVVAEARGKREDDELRTTFDRITSMGTQEVSVDRFSDFRFELQFVPKLMNVVGTQMADLAAYPIARWVLDSSKANPAYDIVRTKFYCGRDNQHDGLIISP